MPSKNPMESIMREEEEKKEKKKEEEEEEEEHVWHSLTVNERQIDLSGSLTLNWQRRMNGRRCQKSLNFCQVWRSLEPPC